VCKEIKALAPKLPIVVLSAASDVSDKVLLLELGADDYVTKPFSPRELVLRVQAILRRGGPAAAAQGVASYGGGVLVVDEPRRTVTARGTPVQLTPTEWGILVTLGTVPGRVYSRFELINKVRGYEFEGYERTVDSHVKNLRRKIEEDPANPAVIVTVLGGGYRLGLARDD
jgi:DNA-binding response OmpR family regulator